MSEREKLKLIAEEAKSCHEHYQLTAFNETFTPEKVLALLSELEQAERERDAWKRDYQLEKELTDAVRRSGGTTWQYFGNEEPIRFLNLKAHEAEAALRTLRQASRAALYKYKPCYEICNHEACPPMRELFHTLATEGAK